MIFIYLFYAIGRTDCQLTKGHILQGFMGCFGDLQVNGDL